MRQYQKRVVNEKRELDDRIGKLDKFIKSDAFKSVKKFEGQLMREQLGSMIDYSLILGKRIQQFGLSFCELKKISQYQCAMEGNKNEQTTQV